MSAFKALRDVSNTFEQDLRRVSDELFTAKISEPFEDVIANKLIDLSLYTSKLRLLQAKPICASLPTMTPSDEGTTIANYSDTVKWKVVEQQVLKCITQSHAVKALITAPDSTLHADILERKENITEQLTKFKEKEIQLRHLETVLQDRQQQLEKVREEWDTQLGRLRQNRADPNNINQQDLSSPLSMKLYRLEGKLCTLRALLARLATARGGGYDWLADPRHRLRALQLARQ